MEKEIENYHVDLRANGNVYYVDLRANGNVYYRLNGGLHRIGGPAVIEVSVYEHSSVTNPYKAWYRNDKRHRLNAPAQIWPVGNAKIPLYWEFGNQIK